MDEGQTASRFRTTCWTLIARARSGGNDLEALLRRYWSPVYAYLRRRGRDSHDAADLTQAFLSDVVMDRDLIGRADPTRGRFRSFLIAALDRFVIDQHRRRRGRDGKRAITFIPDDPAALKAAEPNQGDDPARAFDRQWATAVLDTALQRVEQYCRGDGMDRQWTAFDARVLMPIRHECEPEPIEPLMERVGATDRQEIYSMLQTVKRKLQRELREVVAETVAEPEDVEIELAELRQFLGLVQ